MNTLDKLFREMDIRDYKYYPIATLHYILNELGLTRLTRNSFGADFISRKVKNGTLVLPPKPAFSHHKLTGEQIKQIVRAFSPGGSGKWVWKPDDSTSEKETVGSSEPGNDTDNEHQQVGTDQQNNDSGGDDIQTQSTPLC